MKGTDFKLTLTNAGTRHYQQLSQEFTSVMNDVVDETLGDADPNDYVRIVMSSDDFDGSLNTPYILRSNINGDWLSELASKLLQSHETFDLENNFILHVQHGRLPRGNGACKRKIAVSMLQNILLKQCVVTSIAQHNDVPCFGYALLQHVCF